MKLISAIINPSRLDAIRVNLAEVGVQGMTVTEVKDYGLSQGRHDPNRGSEYGINFVPKLKIEVAINADLAERVSDAIISTARTGRIGDDRVFWIELQQLIRLRTGESGPQAI
jgi:nitrogen regulatory protein PII